MTIRKFECDSRTHSNTAEVSKVWTHQWKLRYECAFLQFLFWTALQGLEIIKDVPPLIFEGAVYFKWPSTPVCNFYNSSSFTYRYIILYHELWPTVGSLPWTLQKTWFVEWDQIMPFSQTNCCGSPKLACLWWGDTCPYLKTRCNISIKITAAEV